LSKPDETSIYVKEGGECTLSMKTLVELLDVLTKKGKPFRFQAPGFSMFPFIRNLDDITVSPLPSGGPRVGDVVAFINPATGKLVVHRVIGTNGDGYLIRGDNSPEPDGLIPRDNILGYVSRVDRNGRKVTIGSGPERFLIALMSRKEVLVPVLFLAYKMIRPFIKRTET
jgi:hypothetical protein